MSKLYSDNAILWDACELPPNYDRQYVCGYDVDYKVWLNGGSGVLSDPANAPEYRYRDVNHFFDTDPDLGDSFPINPGADKDSGLAGSRGNIRWRHNKNTSANVLFADGTVRTMTKTVYYGTPGVKGDFLRSYLRPKWPPGFVAGP